MFVTINHVLVLYLLARLKPTGVELFLQILGVCVTVSHFHRSLIFPGEAGADPSGASLRVSSQLCQQILGVFVTASYFRHSLILADRGEPTRVEPL